MQIYVKYMVFHMCNCKSFDHFGKFLKFDLQQVKRKSVPLNQPFLYEMLQPFSKYKQIQLKMF